VIGGEYIYGVPLIDREIVHKNISKDRLSARSSVNYNTKNDYMA
jgi:hypothetical protein